jgi:light-regulated signal transduction histidine kinase (bacteriophytochrome)
MSDLVQGDSAEATQVREQMPVRVQSAGFVLVLSPDWLILRASENTHAFFGAYHQRMIGEPLSEFTMAQPLHDLRNSLARQQGASGISRVYRVRLVNEPRYFDIAYQQAAGRILLEGMECAPDSSSSGLGAVSRLVDGLTGDRRHLLEQAARRMRALTGFDRCTLRVADDEVTSSRGPFAPLPELDDLPPMLVDAAEPSVALFPLAQPGGAAGRALLRAPSEEELSALRAEGVHAALSIPVRIDGKAVGYFRCDNRALIRPSFELHGAAELFSQVFAMCWSRAGR